MLDLSQLGEVWRHRYSPAEQHITPKWQPPMSQMNLVRRLHVLALYQSTSKQLYLNIAGKIEAMVFFSPGVLIVSSNTFSEIVQLNVLFSS